MALLEHPELRDALVRLGRGMRSYMEDGDANYSEQDINRCRDILTSHAKTLEQVKNRVGALDLVKSTVLQLNELNEPAGGDLIETDQREEICRFIIQAGTIMGFNSKGEDVTEEWREW